MTLFFFVKTGSGAVHETVTERCGVCLLTAQKRISRPRKFALFQMPATGGGDVCPQADSPALATTGARTFTHRVGGSCRNGTVVSVGRLEIGRRWSAQSPWLFQVQLIYSSRGRLFHFFEARSQNCSGSCRGYSPVVV